MLEDDSHARSPPASADCGRTGWDGSDDAEVDCERRTTTSAVVEDCAAAAAPWVTQQRRGALTDRVFTETRLRQNTLKGTATLAPYAVSESADCTSQRLDQAGDSGRTSNEGPSYWSQSESCVDDSKRFCETFDSCSDAEQAEEVVICYRPGCLKSNLLESIKNMSGNQGSGAGWWASLGPPPCPSMRVRLHHKDTLMIQVPRIIYNKMVAWGHNELIVVAQRRVRLRRRVLGISASDSASEYLTSLCCFIIVITIIYNIVGAVLLLTLSTSLRTAIIVIFVILEVSSAGGPYLMALYHHFRASYVLWCVLTSILIIVKILVAINLTVGLRRASGAPQVDIADHSHASTAPPHLVLMDLEADPGVLMRMASILSIITAIMTDGLSLASSFVLRQLTNLEERLIRVVSVHEKDHKQLNVAPLELWCAGLYNGEKSLALTPVASQVPHRRFPIS